MAQWRSWRWLREITPTNITLRSIEATCSPSGDPDGLDIALATGPGVRGIRGYAWPVSSSASGRLDRIRVTGPIGDPRIIRVAER